VARAWFHADETRLAHFLEGELGLAAADGGELVLPPPALLSEDQWHRAVSSFLES
jgi:glycine cleavage system H protein